MEKVGRRGILPKIWETLTWTERRLYEYIYELKEFQIVVKTICSHWSINHDQSKKKRKRKTLYDQRALAISTELLLYARAKTFNFMVYLLHSAHSPDYK